MKSDYETERQRREALVRSARKALHAIPRPNNDAELEVLSQWYFGVPLHLSHLNIYGDSGSYEVKELYDDYHGTGFQFGKGCVEGYDHSGNFWNFVLGPLYCGGIAGRSYGQFDIKGHRNALRLRRWQNSRGGNVHGSSMRPFFVRLAREVGAGENRISAHGSVLIAGREDGVARGSSRGKKKSA